MSEALDHCAIYHDILNDKTKILRGKTAVAMDDIRTGWRIVVTAVQGKDEDGMVTMVATEVKLAEKRG